MGETKGKTSSGLDTNVAGLLCYVAWWLTGIIFLIIEKENKFVRFHAWQSIFTFGAISIIQIILSFIPVIGWILGIIIWILSVILWIVCMMQAYQGKSFKLPIVGNIAEKQAGKQ
ncbi:MAG TPA: DUF4870 domain-containing protein [Dehalococcoidales bacterium]|nr:DUF4870 domain-containing protein [Dehalococcoidales bacterium]